LETEAFYIVAKFGNGAAEVINLAALAIQSGVTTSELERLDITEVEYVSKNS
jgi:hypothetical protein